MRQTHGRRAPAPRFGAVRPLQHPGRLRLADRARPASADRPSRGLHGLLSRRAPCRLRRGATGRRNQHKVAERYSPAEQTRALAVEVMDEPSHLAVVDAKEDRSIRICVPELQSAGPAAPAAAIKRDHALVGELAALIPLDAVILPGAHPVAEGVCRLGRAGPDAGAVGMRVFDRRVGPLGRAEVPAFARLENRATRSRFADTEEVSRSSARKLCRAWAWHASNWLAPSLAPRRRALGWAVSGCSRQLGAR